MTLSILIQKLHSFAKENRFEKAVIGLSGGLDSAVALCVAVRAFGPKNVTALTLPDVGLTPQDDIDHAKILAEHFGCLSHYQPINNFLVDFSFLPWKRNELSHANLKARTRGSLLKHYAQSQGTMLIGTANKSDLLLGYGTVEGEFTGDLQILGDLYKTDVMALAKEVGLPRELMEKDPSRQLRAHQTDEEDLAGPWSKIDDILKQLSSGADPESLIEKGLDSLAVHKITRMLQENSGRFTHLPVVNVGQISASITKAREAEASSLS